MALYTDTPRLPINYPLLGALSLAEREKARSHGFLATAGDPDMQFTAPEADDLSDWRIRIYVVWFSYIYEHFFEIRFPLRGIEDIFLEFRTNVLNGKRPGPGLAQLYAGAGAWEPTADELKKTHEKLRIYYDTALALLKNWHAESAK